MGLGLVTHQPADVQAFCFLVRRQPASHRKLAKRFLPIFTVHVILASAHLREEM